MSTKKLLLVVFVGACLVALQGCRNGDDSVTLKSNVARLAEAKAAVAIAEARLEAAWKEERSAIIRMAELGREFESLNYRKLVDDQFVCHNSIAQSSDQCRSVDKDLAEVMKKLDVIANGRRLARLAEEAARPKVRAYLTMREAAVENLKALSSTPKK